MIQINGLLIHLLTPLSFPYHNSLTCFCPKSRKYSGMSLTFIFDANLIKYNLVEYNQNYHSTKSSQAS